MADKLSNLPGAAEITALRSVFRGEILTGGDAGYDATRVVWNGMIDRKPLLIARPRNAADVAAAVGFARDHHLPGFDPLGRP